MTQPLLEIRKLSAGPQDKPVLCDLNLTIAAGEVHAVMGPNGSGKSTLAGVLAGRPDYKVNTGSIQFQGEDLLELEPFERARKGLFLAFQYPIEIPGVSTMEFLKTAVESVRTARGEPPLSAVDFLKEAKAVACEVGLSDEFFKRSVNEGFSGGERKRSEIIQMAMLKPALGVLDEIDSGLDIDALQLLSKAVKAMHSANCGLLLITHYQRLLEYITPDRVHVLADGKIVKSGTHELALELEKQGYGWLTDSPDSK